MASPEYLKEWRRKNHERIRAYNEENREHRYSVIKKWQKNNPDKCRKIYRRWASKNKERIRELQRNWIKKNREKRKRYNQSPEQTARVKLINAIRSGKIHRPDHCYKCGLVCKPQGHHSDYSKPLAVIWLCHYCHAKAHS